MRKFGFMFALQFVNFALLCWNYRAIARGLISQVVVSDGVIAALNFRLFKHVVADDSRAGMAGYVLGGMAGSAVSIAITKVWWGV